MGINCVMCFAFLAFACLVEGCTRFENPLFRNPNHDEEDDCKIYHSSHVVVGEVGDKVTASNIPLADVEGVEAYSVIVKCIYKGDNVADTIKVTGIGNLGGQLEGCPPADLKKGQEGVFFLTLTSQKDTFQVEFQPNFGGDISQITDDLSVVCGLKLTVMDPGYKWTCPAPVTEEEGCISYEEPAMPTTEAKPVTKPNKVTTPKSIDTSDGGYVVNPGTDNKGGTDKKDNTAVQPGKSSGGTGGSSASNTLMTSSLLIMVAALVTTIL